MSSPPKRIRVDASPTEAVVERWAEAGAGTAPGENPAVWKAVAQEAGLVYFEWDFIAGTLADISENVADVLGYTRTEFMTDPGLVSAVATERFRQEFNEKVFQWANARPTRVRLEGCFIDRRGREKRMEITGVVDYAPDGRLRGAHMLGTDITSVVGESSNTPHVGQAPAVVHADIFEGEVLREWVSQYQEAFARAPIGLLLLRPSNMTVVEANGRACAIYGLAKELMEGAHIDEVTGDKSLSRAEAALAAAKAGTDEYVVQRATHRRADGTLFPVEVATVSLSMGSEPLRMAMVRDLSEEELSQGTATALRHAVDEAHIALVFMSRHGQLVFGTEAAAWLLGMESEDMPGKDVLSLCAGGFGATLEGALAEAASGRPWRGFVRFHDRSRLVGPVRVSVVAAPTFSSREPDFLVAVITPPDGDINARRMADAAVGRLERGDGW